MKALHLVFSSTFNWFFFGYCDFVVGGGDWFVADPTQVIGLFPELLPSEFRKQLEYPAPPPPLTPGELEKGCLALVEYLTQVSFFM